MTDTDVIPKRERGAGHEIGAVYFSPEHEMTYEVLGSATVWELAPDDAIRVRWSNGNVTTTRRDRLPPQPD